MGELFDTQGKVNAEELESQLPEGYVVVPAPDHGRLCIVDVRNGEENMVSTVSMSAHPALLNHIIRRFGEEQS